MRLALMIGICMLAGCSNNATETSAPSQEVFVGTWRSVTPSLEFLRLSVAPKSSEFGVLGSRLTFSGVAWEGSGKIDGDSLVLPMTLAGQAVPIGTVVAHATDARTLRVHVQPSTSSPLDITFVRD